MGVWISNRWLHALEVHSALSTVISYCFPCAGLLKLDVVGSFTFFAVARFLSSSALVTIGRFPTVTLDGELTWCYPDSSPQLCFLQNSYSFSIPSHILSWSRQDQKVNMPSNTKKRKTSAINKMYLICYQMITIV